MLAAADRSRLRLVDSLRLPEGFYVVLAAGVAVQVAAAGYGIADQSPAGLVVVLAGLAVLGLAGVLVLHRFRQVNGARVDGLSTQVLLGGGPLASTVYLGSLAAATWAAFGSVWWLVAVAAVLGGAGYALGARRWWAAYRRDPAGRTRGLSPLVLAGLGVVTCLGLVTLALLA